MEGNNSILIRNNSLLTTRINSKLKDGIFALAADQGKTVSELIREMIREKLKASGKTVEVTAKIV